MSTVLSTCTEYILTLYFAWFLIFGWHPININNLTILQANKTFTLFLQHTSCQLELHPLAAST